MEASGNGVIAALRKRPWRWTLVALFFLAAVLLFYLRARTGFFLDDWYLVLFRDGPADWMLPHNQHIIILPAAIYELSLSLFGIDPLPLHLVALVLFLISVALLFQWLKPLVGEPVSVLGCAILLFLGAGSGDLLFAFQIGFFGSVVGGLGALLLLRRDTTRNDALACLLLVFSTLCSTLMAPFWAAAAVQLLYRGGTRPRFSRLLRASWIILIPAVIYLIWWAGWNQGGSQEISFENLLRAPAYILAALGFGFASLTGGFALREWIENYLWVLPGIVVAAGFIWILGRRRRVPPEFLVGLAAGLGFWALCALNYTEAREFYTSRYQYPSVIFLLMMLAGACKGLRPDPGQLKWLGAATVIAVAINITGLFYAFSNVYRPYAEQNLVNLAAVDLAWDTIEPDFEVGIGTTGGDQVRADAYKEAVGRYGHPELSDEVLTGVAAEYREELDRLLVRALPVTPLPAAAVKPERDRCRTVVADPAASETLPVRSRLSYIDSKQKVVIRLGRYGDGAHAAAWAALGGKPIGYVIPGDRSGRPWRIGFEGRGEVTICPATDPAG